MRDAFSVKQLYLTFDVRKSRRGLSERIVRRRLEKQGWTVWRGGLIGIVRETEVYPNVRRKYEQLCTLLETHMPRKLQILQYLSSVHHGMPDFVCFRNGEFKFVECKLGYESLNVRQRKCIAKLQQLGFPVEIHRLAEPWTLTREAVVDVRNGKKMVHVRQERLGRFSEKRRKSILRVESIAFDAIGD